MHTKGLQNESIIDIKNEIIQNMVQKSQEKLKIRNSGNHDELKLYDCDGNLLDCCKNDCAHTQDEELSPSFITIEIPKHQVDEDLFRKSLSIKTIRKQKT